MGGPCKTRKQGSTRKTQAPDCTDNFQIRQFQFEGRSWHSVEQAYQGERLTSACPSTNHCCCTTGLKWTSEASINTFEQLTPFPTESSFDYGQRIWKV